MNIKTLFLLLMLGVFAGCSMFPVGDNRAGCAVMDGGAKYGLIQGLTGNAKGVNIYVGDKLKGKIDIICSDSVQQILYK